jgi:hypothetical protein
MIADPLTKGMPPIKFKDHVENMGLGSSLWLYTYSLLIKLLYCDVFSFSCAHQFEKICYTWTKSKPWFIHQVSYHITDIYLKIDML